MASERQRRARRRRRLDLTARTAEASTVPQPRGKPGGPGLFGIKGAQLPPYIQHVRDELIKKGRSESQATEMAIGIVRNWAQGHNRGKPVHPDVQAAAVKAIAAYDALRARAKATPNKGRHDMSATTKPAPAKAAAAKKKPAQQQQPAAASSSGFDSSKHPRGAKGTPTGGKFVSIGKARDAQGAQAQKSKVGKEAFSHEIVASAAVRNKRLTRLDDKQLAALSRTTYSFKSNDPGVVKLRMAIARELAKRGYDVKDFGAQGGGINSNKKLPTGKTPAEAKKVGNSTSRKAEAYTARHGTKAEKARAIARLKAIAAKKGAAK